jgi:DNA-binding SARP family transcriptional activator
MQEGSGVDPGEAGRRRERPGTAPKLAAFELFPYGLLVLDGEGGVVCANAAAVELLGGRPETRCCGLFGCGEPGGSLATGCLAALALERGVIELALELRTPAGPREVLVVAAPLVGRPPRIVLELRPCGHDVEDPGQGVLRIRTLGRTVVQLGGRSVTGGWLHQRSGHLLQYLVCRRGAPASVEEIAESIWPQADYSTAGSVRYHVHTLRRHLEPELGRRAPSRFVCSNGAGYYLNAETVELDASGFERLVQEGLARRETDPDGAAEELGRAMLLYEGDFLAELPYAEWAIAERDRLHALACEALHALAGLHMRQGAAAEARGCLERLVAMQPYDEDVVRELMQLEIASGRRTEALRRYEGLRRRMSRAFGHDPSFTPQEAFAASIDAINTVLT